MLLKSVKLENIRSYTNQEIEFPSGSVLLSGDIGSGKSTILLGIEFALFGVKRKDLSGTALLRHGKKQGSVELKFMLDNKEVIVKRVLKRGKNDISQAAGYIIINGIKKEGTAVELKSEIISLLGYSKELVSKSKDLVYRYTVYTPQEEMKQILLEDKDTRLDTLRRVFNIDKYKRVRENLQIVIKEIRERRKGFEGNIADLEDKKKQKKEREKEISEIDKNIEDILPKIKFIKESIQQKKENIKQFEQDIKDFNELKNQLSVNEAELRNKVELSSQNKKNIEKLKKYIEELEKEFEKKEKPNLALLKDEIQKKENQQNLSDKRIKEATRQLSELNVKKAYSERIKNNILKLSKCPTCQQEVTKEHKDNIIRKENLSLIEFEKNLNLYSDEQKKSEEEYKKLKAELEQLRKKEHDVSIIKLKLENLEEKIKQKDELAELHEKIKREIGNINVKKIELNEKLSKFKDIEDSYKKIRDELEKNLQEERKLELQKTAFEKEIEGIKKLMLTLEKDIGDKLKIKEKLNNLMQLNNWLSEYFINLMGVMERHIMLQVYREFNELFQKWFNILIEDENINVRLDDEFTPIIEQNGYETLIENLSGGERTSVALAYRLALNKVINDIIGEIKTKDIIILDEPTDGFSSEQLDKVREVLDQLNIKQVVLVSHEPKIESFVDNIIRIQKDEHVSYVA